MAVHYQADMIITDNSNTKSVINFMRRNFNRYTGGEAVKGHELCLGNNISDMCII